MTRPLCHHQEQLMQKRLCYSKMMRTSMALSRSTTEPISGKSKQLPSVPGTHEFRIGKGVYINFNCTFLDTSVITIGARTLIGPGCSFFAATHPLDPFLRNGIKGPELGGAITVGEDCWFGGNVTVCPNVTIGRGVTVGAGSVVTKDVPAFHVVAGNPARIIKKIEPKEPDPLLAASESKETVVAAADRI